ncbi:MotE family protein [Oceaniglobus roseus]|uniref:MotE family protein n=1 Tax=Oceaniglobus roseus TaxID=1737570 RepID=UPI000C7EC699|nr:hypothetical protein [Kandeliimicrobium roseum]
MTRGKHPGRRRLLGPLSFLALILALSGALRLAGGTGQAIAREVQALGPASDANADTGACAPDPDVAAVLDALAEREKRVEEREAYIAERSAALAGAEKELTAQLAELKAAEDQLEQTLARADTASEEDIARLTAVYENMKPKEAAALFETMAPDFAAGFLGRMRPDAAAKVIGGLSAEAAYSISVVLAGRNANAPKE